jgi:hypothetical protein
MTTMVAAKAGEQRIYQGSYFYSGRLLFLKIGTSCFTSHLSASARASSSLDAPFYYALFPLVILPLFRGV